MAHQPFARQEREYTGGRVDAATKRKFMRALRGEAVALMAVYLTPLRRWRKWYWRIQLAAVLLGAAVGVAVRFLVGDDDETPQS